MSNNINHPITNPIPSTLNDLLVELKFLSKVERGQKVNMGSMSFADSTSWYDAFYRGLRGEGRRSLIMHIDRIIQMTITAINEYQGTDFCPIIVNNLAHAKIGIQCLSTTYQPDPYMVSQMDVFISNIDMQLEKNRHMLEGHGKNIPSDSNIIQKIPIPKQQIKVANT